MNGFLNVIVIFVVIDAMGSFRYISSLIIFFVGESVCIFPGFNEIIAIKASPKLIDFVSFFIDDVEIRVGSRSVSGGLVICTERIVNVVWCILAESL